MKKGSTFGHRHLKNLRSLDFYGGDFTDSGLSMLSALTALRSLSLCACMNITDEGLKAVVVPLSRQSLTQVEVKGCSKITALSLVSLTRDHIKSHVLYNTAGRMLHPRVMALTHLSTTQPGSMPCLAVMVPKIPAFVRLKPQGCVNCKATCQLDFDLHLQSADISQT